MDFPASLYKPGSTLLWDGEMFDVLDVSDQIELEAALADGWVPHKPGKSEPPQDENEPEAPATKRRKKSDVY